VVQCERWGHLGVYFEGGESGDLLSAEGAKVSQRAQKKTKRTKKIQKMKSRPLRSKKSPH
jgi:hypothetical protein